MITKFMGWVRKWILPSKKTKQSVESRPQVPSVNPLSAVLKKHRAKRRKPRHLRQLIKMKRTQRRNQRKRNILSRGERRRRKYE